MKVPYTNDKTHTVYVGPTSIPPGQTRMVDPSMMNPEPVEAVPVDPAAAAALEIENAHRELLKGNVGSVVAGIKRAVDNVLGVSEQSGATPEEVDGARAAALVSLGQVEALEAATEKPRKTVLEAIAVERLRLSQPPPAAPPSDPPAPPAA